jgi:hypothetical protein
VAQAVEHPSSSTDLGSNPVPHPQRGKINILKMLDKKLHMQLFYEERLKPK